MPSPGIFADTNLLLYRFDTQAPVKQARAADWNERLWRDGIGRTSTQVISELYVNLKREAGRHMSTEEAWATASEYLAWKPRAVDEEVLGAARGIERRHKLSWWDALIVAAAQLQGCDLLLSEDLQDGGVYGTVMVRSPFTLEVRQPAAPHALSARAANLHRPRGRPRRATAYV